MVLNQITIKNWYWGYFLLAISCILFWGCEDDSGTQKDTVDMTTNKAVQEIMTYTYYWNIEIFDDLIEADGQTYKSVPDIAPDKYFKSLLYTQAKAPMYATAYDRWSFIGDYNTVNSILVEGEYNSYGFYCGKTGTSITVFFVYENSPMALAGVERGFKILKINGQNISSLTNATIGDELNKSSVSLVFADREGNVLPEKTISMAVFKINPILCATTYNVGSGNVKKVGYLAYNSFISASEENLKNKLAELQDVDEMILDFRYNGGGDVDVAEKMAEFLVPAQIPTQYKKGDSIDYAQYVFSEFTQKVWQENFIRKIKRNSNALDLQRLFVITSEETASASEEVINNMKPFLDVITIGSVTHGKPVGMFVFRYPDKNPQWAIAPICFRIDNISGNGNFFGGIAPNFQETDDLGHDFGRGEACLEAALQYIETGQFPQRASLKSVEKPQHIILRKGVQIYTGCL